MDEICTIAVTKGIYASGSRDGSARVWEIDRTGGKNRVIANLMGHKQKIVYWWIYLFLRLCLPSNHQMDQINNKIL